jgi:hypothetical protein
MNLRNYNGAVWNSLSQNQPIFGASSGVNKRRRYEKIFLKRGFGGANRAITTIGSQTNSGYALTLIVEDEIITLITGLLSWNFCPASSYSPNP